MSSTLSNGREYPDTPNEPNILYNRSGEFDARGIPKVGNLGSRYQDIYESLFLAIDRCYFIMNEPHKILHEDEDNIIFEHTKTREQIKLSRDNIYTMMNEKFKEGSTKLYIPSFGDSNIQYLRHKLEIDQLSLQDQETKDILLEWYDNIFSNLKEGEYPSDQWAINSLFYTSILLDFDKDKQKNMAKYFINNCLNTLYREEDRHYGLHKQYNAQQVWDKIGLSIQGIEVEKAYKIYLSVKACKEIADRVGITEQEFSDILYDVCLFKLGNEKKGSASSDHRTTHYGLEEIQEYLLGNHKKDIANSIYISERSSWNNMFDYRITAYDLLRATTGLGLSLTQQKERIEEIENEGKRITQQEIWLEAIKEKGKDITIQYKDFQWDVDIEQYKRENENKNSIIYLVHEGDFLVITNKLSEGREILGSINMTIYEKKKRVYDEDIKRTIINEDEIEHLDINIYRSPNLKKEYVDGMLKVFDSSRRSLQSNDIPKMLSLRSVQFGE